MRTLGSAKIGVVGLGYVGLPLAVEFGKHYPTLGLDIKQHRVEELRAGHDAVLIGSATQQTDNPSLTLRMKERKHRPDKPWRIVLDARFKTALNAKVLRGKQLTCLAVSEKKLTSVLKSKPEVTDNPIPSDQKVSDLKEAYDKWQQDGSATENEKGGADIPYNGAESADRTTVETGGARSEKTAHEEPTKNG